MQKVVVVSIPIYLYVHIYKDDFIYLSVQLSNYQFEIEKILIMKTTT